MILIVSHLGDDHATAVAAELAAAGSPAVMVDTARFPGDMTVELTYANGRAWTGAATVDGARIDLAEVGAVWWRRPQPYEVAPEVTGPEDREFAYQECHAAVSGLWACLDATWMNDPMRDEVASRKAFQLKVASALGLRVPHTLITNGPAAATAFIDAQGDSGTIYKAFLATERAWRETRLLKPEERAQLAAVRYAPVIFQEYVRATVDLRITVVGERIFPAEIVAADGGYPVDFRMTMHEATMGAHVLPDAVAQDLRALMRALGLVYGAIDMRLTPDGEYVFLEVNTAGQWLFIQERTGQPITAAVAAQLVEFDCQHAGVAALRAAVGSEAR